MVLLPLVYLKNNYQIHPVDFIIILISKIEKDKGKMGNLYNSFIKDYIEAETFDTEESLYKYWSKDNNFSRLKSGEYGKLNMLYTYKIVLELREEFMNFLLKLTKEVKEENKIKDNDFQFKCSEILKFQNCKFIQFNSEKNLINNFDEEFKFDILNWIDNDSQDLNKFKKTKKYKFYFNDNKKNALEVQLTSNKSKNLNSKLRDMTVYTSTKMFFYNVKEL